MNALLDCLAEAVITSKECPTSDEGAGRSPALSIGGLAYLSRHKLWRQAMQRVVAIGRAHPDAQRRFLDLWMRVGFVIRPMVGEDALLIAALRVLLPAYDGPPIMLYRG